MKKLIRKILREEIDKSDRHYRILDIISDHVQIPYFKSMEGLTIYDKDDQEYIMRKIYDNDIDIIKYHLNEKGVGILMDGYVIYKEQSDGYWQKWGYDNGYRIYHERSDGKWWKWEYNKNGNEIYFEDSDGWWVKREYGDNGNQIYYENSDGDIRDNR
jgi:hypothetical protein